MRCGWLIACTCMLRAIIGEYEARKDVTIDYRDANDNNKLIEIKYIQRTAIIRLGTCTRVCDVCECDRGSLKIVCSFDVCNRKLIAAYRRCCRLVEAAAFFQSHMPTLWEETHISFVRYDLM